MTDPSTRLERAIAQLGAEHEPPPGWQAQVLAAIEATKQPKPSLWTWLRRWWYAVATPVLVAGTATVLLFAGRPSPLLLATDVKLPDSTRVVRGDPNRSRDHVPLGSRIMLTVQGGKEHRALWVYRDERELLARCPGQPACQASDPPRYEL